MIERGSERSAAALSIALCLLRLPSAARAEDTDRPAIEFNRWQEDWSVLANPAVPREPLDQLKYIPLSSSDPHTYLSLGADLRERFEANDAAGFGIGPNRNADYDISRLEVHADARLAGQVQFFAQLQSDDAIDKKELTPVDQDRLDLEQAFIALVEPLDGGTLKFRFGRQQFSFDLQRFVSARDGPNVRQSYDAAWVDYERGPWRFISFYSQPVQDRDLRPFDDYSSDHLTYGGIRAERELDALTHLAIYLSRFTQDAVKFPGVTGNERRGILDAHLWSTRASLDWELEAMGQTGQIGTDRIRAWAIGSLDGYTFMAARWRPRLGVQLDAASGDRNPNDHELNTFNPLFPNGYYVTLAGYTGYTNFIHLKPSITVHPNTRLKLMAAVGAQWRETTADAVYTQPDIPVAGTAGHPGRYTGTYGQSRIEYAATSHLALALEVVHFQIGSAIHEAGGHDSNYAGAQFTLGW
jgi:hypothetical protein